MSIIEGYDVEWRHYKSKTMTTICLDIYLKRTLDEYIVTIINRKLIFVSFINSLILCVEYVIF